MARGEPDPQKQKRKRKRRRKRKRKRKSRRPPGREDASFGGPLPASGGASEGGAGLFVGPFRRQVRATQSRDLRPGSLGTLDCATSFAACFASFWHRFLSPHVWETGITLTRLLWTCIFGRKGSPKPPIYREGRGISGTIKHPDRNREGTARQAVIGESHKTEKRRLNGTGN